jgi:hypothetical protein
MPGDCKGQGYPHNDNKVRKSVCLSSLNRFSCVASNGVGGED